MFRFRFQTVLDQKRTERDQIALELWRANEQLLHLNRNLQDSEEVKSKHLRQLAEATKPGVMELTALLHHRQVIAETTKSIADIHQEIVRVNQSVSELKSQLVEAERAVKTFEKLEEKHRKEFEADAQRKEQHRLDEVAAHQSQQKRAA
ncbi:MAG: flagellar export protein FliJ [Planctomycetaceae bacterium]|nr:flagellar export protein FliJ [Planctomycetaceae bacterium]